MKMLLIVPMGIDTYDRRHSVGMHIVPRLVSCYAPIVTCTMEAAADEGQLVLSMTSPVTHQPVKSIAS